jgi:hypothetical protein
MEADRLSQDRSSILDRSSNLDSDDPLRVLLGLRPPKMFASVHSKSNRSCDSATGPPTSPLGATWIRRHRPVVERAGLVVTPTGDS